MEGDDWMHLESLQTITMREVGRALDREVLLTIEAADFIPHWDPRWRPLEWSGPDDD